MGSRAAVALAVALLLAAPTAMAAPTSAERETARRLMDDGKARTKAGDLTHALEAYQKAHAIMGVPTTGMAVAKTHYAMGHLVEAREAALEVVRMEREPGEPAVFDRARKQAKDLAAQVEPRIPTVRIRIRGEPAAQVTVDDVEIPLATLDAPVPMNPGSRIIAARSEAGAEARTQVALSEKDAKEIELELLPTKNTGKGSGSGTRKVIGLSLEGERGGERTGAANALIFGGFGLAVSGAIVGGVTGAIAFSKAGDVKPQCENGICDPAAASDLESARSMALVSNIGFAAAAGGLVLGIVGLALPRTRSDPSVGFYVLPSGAGVRGAF